MFPWYCGFTGLSLVKFLQIGLLFNCAFSQTLFILFITTGFLHLLIHLMIRRYDSAEWWSKFLLDITSSSYERKDFKVYSIHMVLFLNSIFYISLRIFLPFSGWCRSRLCSSCYNWPMIGIIKAESCWNTSIFYSILLSRFPSASAVTDVKTYAVGLFIFKQLIWCICTYCWIFHCQENWPRPTPRCKLSHPIPNHSLNLSWDLWFHTTTVRNAMVLIHSQVKSSQKMNRIESYCNYCNWSGW